ncbi:MAG TPA: hypothetical protein VIR79_07105 [Nitrospira sp.]
MEQDQSTRGKMRMVALGVIAGMLWVAMAGCSSEKPKPMVQPTTEQIRGHADQTFDKLKKEEQGRNVEPPAAR